MGLDIALGIMILISATRGWMRGFILQAVRLGGLVGGIYLADPVRDLAKPYVAKHLGSIPPIFLDRLLWWTSAISSYLIMVGLASLAIKMSRRRSFGEFEPSRADQFGGFLLGGAKGAITVAFLTAGINDYGSGWAKGVDWADEQVKSSQALALNEQYHPATKIWNSQPVQILVERVQTRGLRPPGGSRPTDVEGATLKADTETARAGEDAPRLAIPSKSDEDKLAEELREVRQQLEGFIKPESR